MIIISKSKLRKCDRFRFVKYLRKFPTGLKVWSGDCRTIDEAEIFVFNHSKVQDGEFAIAESPVVNKELLYDWMTPPVVQRYKLNKGRAIANEEKKEDLRQSIRIGIFFITITPVTFLFNDFELDLEGGRCIVFPSSVPYGISQTNKDRYLIYRYLMYHRYH